jgi:FlaA1/EpsC-like NDP-sugar epimerase
VTHPDATRYFMTIPEAVQLILQASLLPAIRGQIAMLEMGEPVRIADLAKNLLRLAGANGRSGQQVVFTGLRPGEKLHEELVAPDEGTIPTEIPKIRLVTPASAVVPRMSPALRGIGNGRDPQIVLASFMDSLAGMFPDLRIPGMGDGEGSGIHAVGRAAGQSV